MTSGIYSNYYRALQELNSLRGVAYAALNYRVPDFRVLGPRTAPGLLQSTTAHFLRIAELIRSQASEHQLNTRGQFFEPPVPAPLPLQLTRAVARVAASTSQQATLLAQLRRNIAQQAAKGQVPAGLWAQGVKAAKFTREQILSMHSWLPRDKTYELDISDISSLNDLQRVIKMAVGTIATHYKFPLVARAYTVQGASGQLQQIMGAGYGKNLGATQLRPSGLLKTPKDLELFLQVLADAMRSAYKESQGLFTVEPVTIGARVDFRVKTPGPSIYANCLAQAISEALTPAARQRADAALKEFSAKYLDSGANIEAATQLAKKLKIGIRFYDAMHKLWHEVPALARKLVVHVLCHQGHAQLTTKTVKLKFSKTPVFHANYEQLRAAYEAEPGLKSCVYSGGGKLLSWSTATGCHRLPCELPPQQQQPAGFEYKVDQRLLNASSRQAASKILLGFKALSPEVFDFVKSADYERPAIRFSARVAVAAYDQNRAYASFYMNRWYSQYLFPLRINCAYSVPAEMQRDYSLLDLCGFSQISAVDYSAVDHAQFPGAGYLASVHYLVNGKIYANFLLKWLHDSVGVDFVIKAVFYSPERHAFDTSLFHEKSADRMLLGALIQRDMPRKIVIETTDEAEVAQLKNFSSVDQVQPVMTMEPRRNAAGAIVYSFCYEQPARKSYSQLHHVHAFVLAYQQTEFLEALLRIPFSEVVAVKTDCIFCASEQDKVFGEQLAAHHEREFYEKYRWKRETHEKLQPNELTPWLSEYRVHCGDSTDDEASEHRGPSLNCVPQDTSRLPVFSAEIRALGQYHAICGPAGSGKSYYLTHSLRLFDCCVIAATNKLVNKFKAEGLNARTYHNYCGIGCSEHVKPGRASTVIIDDASLITAYDFNRIVDYCTSVGSCVYVTWDPHQLLPMDRVLFTQSNSWRWFFGGVSVQHMETLHRFKDPETRQRITEFRKILVGSGTQQQPRYNDDYVLSVHEHAVPVAAKGTALPVDYSAFPAELRGLYHWMSRGDLPPGQLADIYAENAAFYSEYEPSAAELAAQARTELHGLCSSTAPVVKMLVGLYRDRWITRKDFEAMDHGLPAKSPERIAELTGTRKKNAAAKRVASEGPLRAVLCSTHAQELTYAVETSTIHVTQGETLDGAVYVDCTNLYALSFDLNLFYVAVSRVSLLQNLYLIV